MKKPVNFVISTLCASALASAASTAQAFDVEDYATTYRATRDAYWKAANELRLANGKFRLYAGVMALYGWADHYTNGSNPEAISRYGWPTLPEARECRSRPDSFDGRPPAYPEATVGDSVFVVGFRGYKDKGAVPNMAAGADAYMHFRTSGYSNTTQVISDYIAAFPFSNEESRTQAAAVLQSDLALAEQGISPYEQHPSRDSLGIDQAREQLYWHYQTEFGAPSTDTNEYYNGDGYNALHATPAELRFGEYCYGDASKCPDGISCVDSFQVNGVGVGWFMQNPAMASSPMRFRCAYENLAPVWPPKRVDPLAEGNWPALLGVNDPGDATGAQARNGVSEDGVLSDFYTTYRATRDAYLKAANEKNLATGPYEAARAANRVAQTIYYQELSSMFE
jgi:hypothetical protein